MTNNLIFAARRTEYRGALVLQKEKKGKPLSRSSASIPFYCNQRIRFDLRLLPRVAFVVGFAAAAHKLYENSGMKLVLDPRQTTPFHPVE